MEKTHNEPNPFPFNILVSDENVQVKTNPDGTLTVLYNQKPNTDLVPPTVSSSTPNIVQGVSLSQQSETMSVTSQMNDAIQYVQDNVQHMPDDKSHLPDEFTQNAQDDSVQTMESMDISTNSVSDSNAVILQNDVGEPGEIFLETKNTSIGETPTPEEIVLKNEQTEERYSLSDVRHEAENSVLDDTFEYKRQSSDRQIEADSKSQSSISISESTGKLPSKVLHVRVSRGGEILSVAASKTSPLSVEGTDGSNSTPDDTNNDKLTSSSFPATESVTESSLSEPSTDTIKAKLGSPSQSSKVENPQSTLLEHVGKMVGVSKDQMPSSTSSEKCGTVLDTSVFSQLETIGKPIFVQGKKVLFAKLPFTATSSSGSHKNIKIKSSELISKPKATSPSTSTQVTSTPDISIKGVQKSVSNSGPGQTKHLGNKTVRIIYAKNKGLQITRLNSEGSAKPSQSTNSQPHDSTRVVLKSLETQESSQISEKVLVTSEHEKSSSSIIDDAAHASNEYDAENSSNTESQVWRCLIEIIRFFFLHRI